MIQSVIIIVVPLIMCAMCHLNYKETFNIRPDTMPRKELVHVLTTSTTSHRPSKRYTLVERWHSQTITAVGVFENCEIKLARCDEY